MGKCGFPPKSLSNLLKILLYTLSIFFITSSRKYSVLNFELLQILHQSLQRMWIIHRKRIVQDQHVVVPLSEFFYQCHFIVPIIHKAAIKDRCFRRVFHHHIRLHHIRDKTFDSWQACTRKIPFRHHIILFLTPPSRIYMCSYPVFRRRTELAIHTHQQFLFIRGLNRTRSIQTSQLNTNKWAQDSTSLQ